MQWLKPSPEEIKVNTDGSRNILAIAAFILTHDQGAWLGGIAGKLGMASVLNAELHGIKYGLIQAWNREFRRVWCETDSQLVVSLITSCLWQKFHSCAVVLEDIHALLSRDWHVRVTHAWHEANRCADTLARLGGEGSEGLKTWLTPLQLLPLLNENGSGVIYQRV